MAWSNNLWMRRWKTRQKLLSNNKN